MEEKEINFNLPDNTIIWRYMNLEKYIDLLESQSMFFCRADKFNDQFEGATPKAIAEQRKIKTIFIRSDTLTEEEEKLLNDYMVPAIIESNKLLKQMSFINCWHIHDRESDNMWRIYTDLNKGIAIKSTIGQLKRFLEAEKYGNIHIGKVEYIDYETYNYRGFDCLIYERFFYKRENYAHEQEVRAIVQFLPKGYGDLKTDEGLEALKKQELHSHIKLSNNIETLIDSVYISPYSSPLFNDVINSVTKKYYPNLKIKSSRLADDPLY